MRYRLSMELALTVAVMCVFGCASEAGSSASSGGAGVREFGAGAAAWLPNDAGSGAGGSASKSEGCLDSQVDCNGACLGAGDEGGGCTVLAATGSGVDVQSMVLDDAHVYWAEQGTRTALARALKTEGGREQLIETEHLPGELAVSASSVIWSEGIMTRSLRMVPKSGGTPVVLAQNIDEISAMIATDTRVYFASGTSGGQGMLESIGLQSMDRVAHGMAAIWPNAAWIAADDHALYWNVAPGEIRSTTLTGQELARLPSPSLTSAILLVNNDLYLTHGNQGEMSLSRIAADSGARSLLYAGPEVGGRLGASGTTLYFGYPSELYALASGSAMPELAFKTSSRLSCWVADESGIYAALSTAAGETLIVKLR